MSASQAKRSISVITIDDDDSSQSDTVQLDTVGDDATTELPPPPELEIVVRSRDFARTVCAFPVRANRIETLLASGATTRAQVERHARSVRIGVHWRVRELMLAFLRFYASPVAPNLSDDARRLFRELAAGAEGGDVSAFAWRLVRNRPVTFLTSFDSSVLRNGARAGDRDAFTRIGTPDETPPLCIADYISYAEMTVSALLTVSAYTTFINAGERNNCGRRGAPGSFVPEGVYIAAVGARFERDCQMETLFCVVNRNRSTPDNGYGANGSPQGEYHGLLGVFAPFYGLSHFPSWQEAVAEYTARTSDRECRYSVLHGGELFDRRAYRARIRVTLEATLFDANQRGAEAARPALLYVTGLGLGVWAITKIEQSQLFLEELAAAIAAHSLPHVGSIYVAWFPPETQRCGSAGDGDALSDKNGHSIGVGFGNAPPAAPLASNSLLVATFAYDSNSMIGNEYWEGALQASADPAAAACCTISEIENAFVNPYYDASATTILRELP
jgi:hypothetical protein